MYIDAINEKSVIRVAERINGTRVLNDLPPVYEFYYEDGNGEHIATTGHRVTRVECADNGDFYKKKKMYKEYGLFESDHNVVFKTLNRYYDGSVPDLHIMYFDIEVDWDAELGYASVDDPFMPITAFSCYLNWVDTLLGLVIKPKNMSKQEAVDICSKFDNVILCDSEEELLDKIIDLFDDVDIHSGWNSAKFDIPYITNRIARVKGSSVLTKLCLWNKMPVTKVVQETESSTYTTFEYPGKIHLDYLDLYKKHNGAVQDSYKLDYIASVELDDHKVQYDGTLDELYNNDFSKFIEYSLYDTHLLKKLDDNFKYITLFNEIAHSIGVLIPSVMGTVAWIDQAIINEAHHNNLIVPDKKDPPIIPTKAAGARVVDTIVGLHKWIGSIDVSSMYPSDIRSLNMSPETIFGQVRPILTEEFLFDKVDRLKLTSNKKGVPTIDWAEAWNGLFATLEYDLVITKDTKEQLLVDFEDGSTHNMTGAEIYEYVHSHNLVITANATIFRKDKPGVIPLLLGRWFKERKEMKAKANEYADLASTLAGQEKHDALLQSAYWNRQQQIRKIQLNSLYGCLLQEGSKFYDRRLGQSTTLTGRMINRHMCSKVNEIITGNYHYEGVAVIAGDTDSCWKSAILNTSLGIKNIETLFNECQIKWNNNDKEYAVDERVKVSTYQNGTEQLLPIKYVYRHKVSKGKYKITTSNNKSVIVTEDHSIMVKRNNELIEVKPKELVSSDIIITVN